MSAGRYRFQQGELERVLRAARANGFTVELDPSTGRYIFKRLDNVLPPPPEPPEEAEPETPVDLDAETAELDRKYPNRSTDDPES